MARRLFEKLSLGSILDAGRPSLRHGQPLSERVFPLLANRLTRPGSEHALAQWLEDFYVCTAQGSRWTPAWKQHRRVKVDFEQLKLWYKTLDDLLAEKPRIEKEIYLELRNLFSLKPDLAFYDITSTYFEGAGPAELGRFGYSRDGKPRNPQVVIGVVMMEGWPIAHHVFAGNRLDQTTVLEVVQDLNARFDLNRVVFVGDRGMMTIGNVDKLRDLEQGYLVGLQRRNRKDTTEYIQQAAARTDWQECPVGITASEKKTVPQTRVVEVAGKQAGVRVFVVHSEERELYERGMRELSMERTRKELEALQKQVEKGELKEADKIGAAAATKLRRNHGHRYFDWELRQGKFRFFDHPVNLAREKALEGKYVIQTEERNLSALEAVAAYKELNEVERGFSHLKSLLELRPVYHRKDARRAGPCVRGGLGPVAGSRPGEESARGGQQPVHAVCLAGVGDGALRGSGPRPAPQDLRHPRKPACHRGAAGSGDRGVGPALSAGRTGDPHVVTKRKTRPGVFNSLRRLRANMR